MKTFEKHYGISWEQMHKPENHAIHHINGNRKDNNFNNLCVMTRSDHTKLHWEQGDIRGEKSGL